METEQICKNARRTCSRIGLYLAIFFIMMNAMQYLLMQLGTILFPELATQKLWFSYLTMAVANYGISFPIFCLLMRSLSDPEQEEREKKQLKAWEFIKLFLIGYGMLYVGNLIGTGINALIALVKGQSVINPIASMITAESLPYMIILTVVFAPIVEETIFRKLILNKLRVYGDKIAILFTALTFGLLHGNLSQFFYAFFLGLLLAYIAIRTNRILYSVLLHIFINALGSGVGPFILYVLKSDILIICYSILLIVLSLSGIVLFFLKRKKIYLEDGLLYLPPKRRISTLYLNPGMIIYFVICALSFLFIISI